MLRKSQSPSPLAGCIFPFFPSSPHPCLSHTHTLSLCVLYLCSPLKRSLHSLTSPRLRRVLVDQLGDHPLTCPSHVTWHGMARHSIKPYHCMSNIANSTKAPRPLSDPMFVSPIFRHSSSECSKAPSRGVGSASSNTPAPHPYRTSVLVEIESIVYDCARTNGKKAKHE